MVRRLSSVDRLPQELRELIGRKRQEGCTLDEILAHLNQLSAGISRAALGRHVKTLEDVGERMRRARVMAEALTAKFGDQPDDQVARLNFELMHSMIFELQMAAASSEDDEDGNPVTFDAKQAGQLARALKDVVSAQKVDADRTLKIQEDARRKAAASAGAKAKALGMSAEVVAQIEHAVLGVE